MGNWKIIINFFYIQKKWQSPCKQNGDFVLNFFEENTKQILWVLVV